MDRLADLAIARIAQLEHENAALAARLDQLQAALKEYGRHNEACTFARTGGPCGCGWDAHEAALSAGEHTNG